MLNLHVLKNDRNKFVHLDSFFSLYYFGLIKIFFQLAKYFFKLNVNYSQKLLREKFILATEAIFPLRMNY